MRLPTPLIRAVLPALLVLSPGCLKEVGRGPFLGQCANYPEGVYAYGDIGIGTCLAGPVDVQFVERDGSTWLAVANADPYRNFSSGSVLLIEWDSIDLSNGFNLIHELETRALSTDHYMGGLGFVESRDLLLATSRLSETARTTSARDDLFVLDIGQDQPAFWNEGPRLQLRDDPQPIVVDESTGRAYVANITDHSISVLDITTSPLGIVDVASFPQLEEPVFFDADDSSSLAAISNVVVQDVALLTNDTWQVDFLDGTYRLWVHDDAGDIVEFSTSGNDVYRENPLGVVFTPDDFTEIEQLVDPTFVLADSAPLLYFSNGSSIHSAQRPTGSTRWVANSAVFTGSSWDRFLGGPSLGNLRNVPLMFYSGRRTRNGDSSIGVAFAEDNLGFRGLDAPVIEAPDGSSYTQPYARPGDPITGDIQLWFSHFDGTTWRIAHSTSYDAFEWTDVEDVLEVAGGHAAAPAVTYAHGNYRMWLTVSTDGATWQYATATSFDGRTWSEPTVVLDSDYPFDLSDPPRAALQVDLNGEWRVEGDTTGRLSTTAVAGVPFITLDSGFSFAIAGGQEVQNDVVPDDLAVNGLSPTSHAVVNGVPTVYATGVDGNGVNRIHALQEGNGGNLRRNNVHADIVDVLGARRPVVYGEDGAWHMLFAAPGRQGKTTMRYATSSDGLSWEPQGVVFTGDDAWNEVSQIPHAVQVRDDGATLRIYYTGSDGSRERIGALEANLADDGSFGRLRSVGAGLDPFLFGTGEPGDFDDSGVRDPAVFVNSNGRTEMYYAGFDGLRWAIGHAVERNDGSFQRRTDPIDDDGLPAMVGVDLTFSALGVRSPAIASVDDDQVSLWVAGFDGAKDRLGRAFANVDRTEVIYAEQRPPTAGDHFTFTTQRSDYDSTSVIELAQAVQEFQASGIGISSMALDANRGFLYVVSKLSNFVYVVDVRDDSNATFTDGNYLDLEAIVQVSDVYETLGFRDIAIDGDHLYLSSRLPDGVVVIDISVVEDNARKEAYFENTLAMLPTLSGSEDAGPVTFDIIAGAKLALHPDGRTLLMSHFRDNAVYVYDLEVGAFGELVKTMPYLGENPYALKIHPDGDYAVVANYVGDVEDFETHSTLTILDLDTLEPVTWIGNQLD